MARPDDRLLDDARAWAEADPDPATRAELEDLCRRGDADGLRECFSGALEFGTAGLRGLVGPGPSKMNAVTVGRIAAGLARQLAADLPGARERGVVLGRDARRGSPELARLAAEVLLGHGFRVHWFPDPTPTPVVAFAGLHLGAAATGIVTASHNPPRYNGFKVYSERGSQIVPPQDARISAFAVEAAAGGEIPRLDLEEGRRRGLLFELGDELAERYLAALDLQCQGPVPPPARVSAVTTQLHGVGHVWVERALRRRGHTDLHPVLEQSEPDGAFPTVAFPNPEEPGALDLALAKARETSADLVLANDPDTDRLAVAARDPAAPEGYRVLSGNELGVLLGDWLLRARARRGALPPGAFVCTTLVSTTLLGRVARGYGAGAETTLTGLKWIWDRALARIAEGGTFVFGFEEALGYSVGPAVRDKDGIGAAQVLMELASDLAAGGRTLLDRLDEIDLEHGVHVTRQVSSMLPGIEGRLRIDGVMARLRSAPPARIGGLAVATTRDLLGPAAGELDLPPSDVLVFDLEGEGRILVRPSGTEPKIKSYIEVREPVGGEADLAGARRRASLRADAAATWLRELIEG